MKKEIVSGRLRLSALRERDRDALIPMLTDPELTATYMVPPLDSEEKRTALFERLKALSEDENRFVFAVFRGEKLVGMIHETAKTDREIELGYFIDPAEKGRGFATETLRAAICELRDRGYATVKAGAFAENAASLRVMEKCGMTPTGETETIEYRGKRRSVLYRVVNF